MLFGRVVVRLDINAEQSLRTRNRRDLGSIPFIALTSSTVSFFADWRMASHPLRDGDRVRIFSSFISDGAFAVSEPSHHCVV
jgi:hypothetical protein